MNTLDLSIVIAKEAAVQKKPFSLYFWEVEFNKDAEDYAERNHITIYDRPEVDCGTVCCLAGLIMNDPVANTLGLHKKTNNIDMIDASLFQFFPIFMVGGRELAGLPAIAAWWGVDLAVAEAICAPCCYQDNQAPISEVISRMETLRDHGPLALLASLIDD